MYIESTDSTNTRLKELIANGEWPETETYLRAGYQTAGRGQAGNGWESAPGENLLCSILLPARKNLFELNVVAAVAVQRLVTNILHRVPDVNQQSVCGGESGGTKDFNDDVVVSPCPRLPNAIKWPNDIYWQDKKVAGILVENAIIGNEIKYSIAGIGLNVNQIEWQSDAPNPISLKQITGKTYDIEALMQQLYAEVQKALTEDLWDYYKAHLYRREGYWPFVEREVSVAPTMNAHADANAFLAHIEDVLPTGELVLRDKNNQQRIYHFKQIRYMI